MGIYGGNAKKKLPAPGKKFDGMLPSRKPQSMGSGMSNAAQGKASGPGYRRIGSRINFKKGGRTKGISASDN